MTDNQNTVVHPKALTNEEFEKLKNDVKDIAQTFQADPELYTDFLAFKAQFYQFSVRNTLLIQHQNPYATFTASFKQWEKLGYRVNKGEKHMKILRPIEQVKFERIGKDGKPELVDIRKANNEEKAKIHKGEIKTVTKTVFIPHQVFDISQTNCPKEDYPKIYSMGYESVPHAELYNNVKEYAQSSGFDVREEKLDSIALHGFYQRDNDLIVINSMLNDSKKLSTMCHELAHGVLHKTSTLPQPQKEFEAECFGVMLQRKFGFPVEDGSKQYIKQYYNKLDKTKNFDADKTLSRLGKTFNHVAGGIDQTLEKNGHTIGMNRTQNLEQTQSHVNKGPDMAKMVAQNFTQNL